MELNEIKALVEHSYNMEIKSIEKIKNVYKVCDNENIYCLKVIKYELPHFLFILGAIKHLNNRGFTSIPEILKTSAGGDYIKLGSCHAYLTPWIEARESNYDNPIDIAVTAKKMAELHKKSENFELDLNMKPRVGWLKWIETFKARRSEILDFKRRIEAKNSKTEFDSIYLKNMEEELLRCDKSINNLVESEYLCKMSREIEKRGFCHHDFAHHNVLVGKNGEIYIIDFDYCILDTHLHDLSSFLIRRMKNGKWDINNANSILEAYNTLYMIESSDIPIMAAFMEFPQDYWQVGIQYYWEKQPWGEDFFLKKLGRILEDNDERQDFVDDFREFIYKG